MVVDVEEISYLYNPKRDPAEKPLTPTKKKCSLQERFKKRTQNRKTLRLSSSSTSQMQLGKRKAGSEDEVDDVFSTMQPPPCFLILNSPIFVWLCITCSLLWQTKCPYSVHISGQMKEHTPLTNAKLDDLPSFSYPINMCHPDHVPVSSSLCDGLWRSIGICDASTPLRSSPPPPYPYDLEAIYVFPTSCNLLANAPYAQVVAFRAGTHLPSPIWVDSDFSLIGEIGIVWARLQELFTRLMTTSTFSLNHCRTMRRICPTANELTARSYIPWGATNTHLTIRVFISPRTSWAHPEQRLPCINSIATFFGNLVTMQEDVAIVALNNIIYLPHPGRTGNPLQPLTFPAIQISASD